MTEILIGDFLLVLLIFLRIFSMMIAAPVLGHSAIPSIARIFIAFVVAYLTFLTIDKSKIIIDVNFISLAMNAVKEIITGLIMGYALNFIFWGISYAGYLIGFDMGLMMAEVMDPSQETSNNVVGEVIFYSSTIIFILINGHHHLITALVSSFKIIPIAKYTANKPVVDLITRYAFGTFTIALKVAAPLMVSFLLIHIAEGIISKVIPSIQIISVTPPLKIGLGLVFMAVLSPLFVFAIKNLLNSYENQLSEIIKSMSV
jgi:flagellar biosynthesis protein FliR